MARARNATGDWNAVHVTVRSNCNDRLQPPGVYCLTSSIVATSGSAPAGYERKCQCVARVGIAAAGNLLQHLRDIEAVEVLPERVGPRVLDIEAASRVNGEPLPSTMVLMMWWTTRRSVGLSSMPRTQMSSFRLVGTVT